MSKLILSLLMLSISFSSFSFDLVVTEDGNELYTYEQVNSNQSAHYKETDCVKNAFNKIVATMLPEVQSKLDDQQLEGTPKIISYEFCSIGDQTQGSYSVERVVRYCIDLKFDDNKVWSGTLSFQTWGDYFCEGEELLSSRPVEVWIH